MNAEVIDIEIIAINTSAEQQQAFVSLALELDQCFPHQIPRFREAEEALLDKHKNFFFQRGDCQCWLAKKGNQYVGRIAAMIDREIFADKANPKMGFIGLYEAEQDAEVADALINTAVHYLQNQGCESVTGPIDFSIYHRYRYQSNHFDSPCFIGEPRNPQYYLQHFIDHGFATSHLWESHLLSLEAMEKSMAGLELDYQQSLALGYQFVAFKHYGQEKAIYLLWQLIQKTYTRMPGFIEVDFTDFQYQYDNMWQITDTDVSLFLVDESNKPIGFSVVFQDKVKAIRSMNGCTDFWAKLRFIFNEHKGEMANAYQTGILYSAIKRAAIRGIKTNKRSLSIAKAIYYHCAVQIRKKPQYKAVIVALLRSDIPNIHITKDFSIQTRHYQLLTRKLGSLNDHLSPSTHCLKKEASYEHI